MKYLVLIMAMLHMLFLYPKLPQMGFVVVPVADLLAQEINKVYGDDCINKRYATIPFCGKKGTYACPRIHQALFNEMVTILEETDQERLIRIQNFYYNTPQNPLCSDYWTKKSNIISEDELKSIAQGNKSIPSPISWTLPNSVKQNNVVTLKEPFFDTKTGRAFSVGTRFIIKNIHHNNIFAYTIDPTLKKIVIIEIPSAKAILTEAIKTFAQQKALFLSLLKHWAHLPNGCSIPYVWGGSSYTHHCHQDAFSIKDSSIKNEPIQFYIRPDNNTVPKNGFDCAGLIARTAQLSGMPFFLKNSITIANNLRMLKEKEPLEAGDIMWVPGHVMVVSDVAKNLVIEARSYSHGYGKVHEISLAQIFDGITTYKDLKDAFFNKKTIKRKNKDGGIVQVIPEFKLLKLSSIYEAK